MNQLPASLSSSLLFLIWCPYSRDRAAMLTIAKKFSSNLFHFHVPNKRKVELNCVFSYLHVSVFTLTAPEHLKLQLYPKIRNESKVKKLWCLIVLPVSWLLTQSLPLPLIMTSGRFAVIAVKSLFSLLLLEPFYGTHTPLSIMVSRVTWKLSKHLNSDWLTLFCFLCWRRKRCFHMTAQQGAPTPSIQMLIYVFLSFCGEAFTTLLLSRKVKIALSSVSPHKQIFE